MERKLAAILAADVVGYTSLMEQNEADTFERLRAHRKELFEPEIARHHGQVFKLMGDGLLAEFGSVVDAVECAVAIQRNMKERNAALEADRRIDVRIGINLGEVIVEGEDRYGEGVNVAARLQQLAEPGGVCVSAKVAREVEKTLAFGFEPMGEQRVKNIATPIAVYRVMLDRGAAPAQRRRLKPTIPRWAWLIAAALLLVVASGTTAWYEFVRPSLPQVVAGHVPSIAVLPLDNLSDDKEQGYLADGITDDLTTALAGIPGLFVISRDAAFTYKGKNVLPAQIAKELGVRYILEGSVRRGGNDMRLNAQLIDTQTGGHIWAERFDGQWTDVFTLQDKLVGAIADALKLRLVTGEGKAKIAGGTSNPAAYEAFLRGLELELRGTPEDIAKAVPLYQQALSLDPNFGRATAELAWVYWNATDAVTKALGFSGSPLDKVNEYLDAAAKHPSPTYYQVLGDWLVHQSKSDEAIANLEKAIALDASDAWSYEEMSYALTFNGRAADGRGYVDAAMRVDPGWTPWRYFLAGLAYFSMDRFEDAIASLEKITQPGDHWSNFYGLILRLSADGHLGRSADFAVVKEKLKPILADDNLSELTGLLARNNFAYKNYADTKRLLDGLHKAGVPELPAGFDPKSKDRLTGAQIKTLFFGHEIRGREIVSGGTYWRKTEVDGTYRAITGPRSFEGIGWIEGDLLCTVLRTRPLQCRAVYRNPAGTFAGQNEYLYFRDVYRFEFSVVK